MVRITSLYLRRLTGTRERPALRVPIYVAIVVVSFCASGLIAEYVYSMIRAAAGVTGILLPVVALAGYLASAPVLLAAEGARDKSGAIESVLASLPLRRFEIRLLTWAPLFLVVAFFEFLLLPPLVAGFWGSGEPFGPALVLALDVTAIGLASAASALALTYGSLRGRGWLSLRTPTAMLIWIAFTALEVWMSIQSIAESEPRLPWLLLPELVYSTAEGTPLVWWLTPVALLLATASLVLLVPIVGDSAERPGGRVRLPWSGRVARSRLIGELIYATRSPSLVGNLIASFVVGVAISIVLVSVGSSAREVLFGPLAAAVCISAGVGARLPRALHPTRRTVPQLVGVERKSWIASQTMVGLACFVFAAIPIVMFVGLATDAQRLEIALVLCTSFGVAHLLSWTIVVPLDNAIGQILAGFITITLGSLFYFVFVDWLRSEPLVEVGLAVVVLALSVLGASFFEGARWRYHGATVKPRPSRHAPQTP